ncbi:MAG: PAS domain-containing protein [Rhodobiaceae bacterium]|nr:PAS domain-containing protein [Rhodobiaceae bacterium]MCC0057133.1 PAS domain-containing protein [Rhodobiaceae bacterium]
MTSVAPTMQEALGQERRLSVLKQHTSGVTDDADLRAIVEIASVVLKAPGAAFASLGPEGERIHVGYGMKPGLTPLDHCLCGDLFTPAPPDVLVLADDAAGRRALKQSPLKLQGSSIRFFAAAPISILGCRIGFLGVYDTSARASLGTDERSELARLAQLAASLLRLKHDQRAKVKTDFALLQAQHRHALALRAANIATWSWDIGSDKILCDETLRRMFALADGSEITGSSLMAAVSPDDREAVRAAIYAAVHRDEEYSGEFRTAAGKRWVLGMGRIHDRAEDGTARTMFGVYLDITERKTAERKTRLLLRELNHRVKNTLAILQSVAQQTLRRSRSPGEFSRAFSGRLQALAAAHTLLSDEEWEDIDIGMLLRSQLLPYAVSYDDNVSVSGPRIALGPDQALALSLVIHELATNAAQHGALTRDSGRVDIDYDLAADEEPPALKLTWVETGGPEVSAPERQGFGSMIIRHSLDKIIGSSIDVDFNPQGMRVIMSVPLSNAPTGRAYGA